MFGLLYAPVPPCLGGKLSWSAHIPYLVCLTGYTTSAEGDILPSHNLPPYVRQSARFHTEAATAREHT